MFYANKKRYKKLENDLTKIRVRRIKLSCNGCNAIPEERQLLNQNNEMGGAEWRGISRDFGW